MGGVAGPTEVTYLRDDAVQYLGITLALPHPVTQRGVYIYIYMYIYI